MTVPFTKLPRPGVNALCGLAAIVLFVAGCRDNMGGSGLAPTPSRQHTTQLRVERAAPGDSTITVTLQAALASSDRSGEAADTSTFRVASLTASVYYDTTRLVFVRDVSPSDGAVRAAHAQNGRVQVAVAHPLGFDGAAVARVTFVARDSAAYQTLRLSVAELHLLDASDARPSLVMLPVEVVR